MLRECDITENNGKTRAHGEMDGEMDRVLARNGHRAFHRLEALLKATGGHAIQPSLFQTPKAVRKQGFFPDNSQTRRKARGWWRRVPQSGWQAILNGGQGEVTAPVDSQCDRKG